MLARHGVAQGSVESEFAQLRPKLLERFLGGDIEVRATGSIDMSEGLVAEGLGPRFYHEPLKGWLRWAESGNHTVLFLPVGKGGPLTFTFEIPYVSSDRISKTLGVLGR
jgi:hypothetical protein